MSEDYKPPFSMTDTITNLIIGIGELTGRITAENQLSANPKLRRENRIKTIYSSLAIEQNTLTLGQVSDVIDGKCVLAPPQDIREVKNAYEAYEEVSKMDPYSIKDLLKAHGFMMAGLVEEAGIFRSKGVGVYAGEQLIHAGTPPQYVPNLMQDLFTWLKKSPLHPLVKSCVFHYEFEFIHPFKDGNGRMGRLWHSLILQKWKTFFAWLPMETLIHEQQEEYYEALNAANTDGESTIFVEFVLRILRETLQELVKADKTDEISDGGNAVGTNVGASVGINVVKLPLDEKILVLIRDNPRVTIKNLASILCVSGRNIERRIAQFKKEGKLERIGASKNGYWKVLDAKKG